MYHGQSEMGVCFSPHPNFGCCCCHTAFYSWSVTFHSSVVVTPSRPLWVSPVHVQNDSLILGHPSLCYDRHKKLYANLLYQIHPYLAKLYLCSFRQESGHWQHQTTTDGTVKFILSLEIVESMERHAMARQWQWPGSDSGWTSGRWVHSEIDKALVFMFIIISHPARCNSVVFFNNPLSTLLPDQVCVKSVDALSVQWKRTNCPCPSAAEIARCCGAVVAMHSLQVRDHRVESLAGLKLCLHMSVCVCMKQIGSY